MDRHIPMHPLPEEIRKMSRDQTVCKYCGISYLILHEFKLLEEKLKVMEEKVKFYERNVEREKILQEKLQCLSQDFEQCTAASKSKTERIKSLSLEIENKHAALQNLSEQLRGLQKEKEISHRQSELLRKALEQRMFIIRKAFVLLPFIREEINSIKEKIFGFSRQWVALKEDIFLHLKSMNVTALEELSSANQSLGECQRENLILEEEVQRLRLVSEAAKQEGEQLQTSLLRESELQNKCHELQKKTQDLTSQIKTIESQLQKSAAEVHHYKELFIKKSKEVEYHQSELQKMAYEVGMSESRFNHALTEREQSLLGCQQACCRLQEEMIEKERKEEDLKKLTKHLESELEAIKNLLKQREEEVVTLKQERASVLISHQTRTEQLQETLRQKVLSEKSWQEKIPLLISSATYNLKMEMDALEKKLHESQAMLTEKNQEREKEWQNLKKQIMELEHQLQKEQSTHHSVTANMKEEIKKKTHELEKLTQEQTQLIQNMNQVQEENALLQDTVRRECEERYELTEALAQAREQVVDLKKLGGNFPLSQCSLSQGSLTSSTRLVSNHGQKNPSCGKGVRLLGLCGISKATDAPVYSARYKSTSHVSLPALPPLQPPGRRTSSSLDESRKKRITAVIKRQLSEL
ncbi:protein LEKR1 isoform X4 [Anolis carolinensis]|uniref:Leucine, glutamate and lysine rich 1 n=1 Tax=Anolis carolinensis TaxID=28377 RepID=A0A803SVG0_ANOCA|nr:PREDICTED: leucine-, glutamate- and lysine-rich protein 1 isoform X4 [Anolis carolinensis]|eukprot:XP_016847520.1 PREDICTED: leucine-, glutamate- and lysine-rich protein 1 isoform X4 [Anolis carolinensis]